MAWKYLRLHQSLHHLHPQRGFAVHLAVSGITAASFISIPQKFTQTYFGVQGDLKLIDCMVLILETQNF